MTQSLAALMQPWRREAKAKLNSDEIFLLDHPTAQDQGFRAVLAPYSKKQREVLQALAQDECAQKVLAASSKIEHKLQELKVEQTELEQHKERIQVKLLKTLAEQGEPLDLEQDAALYQTFRLLEINSMVARHGKAQICATLLQSIAALLELYPLCFFLRYLQVDGNDFSPEQMTDPVFSGIDVARKERIALFASVICDYEGFTKLSLEVTDLVDALLPDNQANTPLLGFALLGLEKSMQALRSLKALRPHDSTATLVQSLGKLLSNHQRPALISFNELVNSPAFTRLKAKNQSFDHHFDAYERMESGPNNKGPLYRKARELTLTVASAELDSLSSQKQKASVVTDPSTVVSGNLASTEDNTFASAQALNQAPSTESLTIGSSPNMGLTGSLNLSATTSALFNTNPFSAAAIAPQEDASSPLAASTPAHNEATAELAISSAVAPENEQEDLLLEGSPQEPTLALTPITSSPATSDADALAVTGTASFNAGTPTQEQDAKVASSTAEFAANHEPPCAVTSPEEAEDSVAEVESTTELALTPAIAITSDDVTPVADSLSLTSAASGADALEAENAEAETASDGNQQPAPEHQTTAEDTSLLETQKVDAHNADLVVTSALVAESGATAPIADGLALTPATSGAAALPFKDEVELAAPQESTAAQTAALDVSALAAQAKTEEIPTADLVVTSALAAESGAAAPIADGLALTPATSGAEALPLAGVNSIAASQTVLDNQEHTQSADEPPFSLADTEVTALEAKQDATEPSASQEASPAQPLKVLPYTRSWGNHYREEEEDADYYEPKPRLKLGELIALRAHEISPEGWVARTVRERYLSNSAHARYDDRVKIYSRKRDNSTTERTLADIERLHQQRLFAELNSPAFQARLAAKAAQRAAEYAAQLEAEAAAEALRHPQAQDKTEQAQKAKDKARSAAQGAAKAAAVAQAVQAATIPAKPKVRPVKYVAPTIEIMSATKAQALAEDSNLPADLTAPDDLDLPKVTSTDSADLSLVPDAESMDVMSSAWNSFLTTEANPLALSEITPGIAFGTTDTPTSPLALWQSTVNALHKGTGSDLTPACSVQDAVAAQNAALLKDDLIEPEIRAALGQENTAPVAQSKDATQAQGDTAAAKEGAPHTASGAVASSQPAEPASTAATGAPLFDFVSAQDNTELSPELSEAVTAASEAWSQEDLSAARERAAAREKAKARAQRAQEIKEELTAKYQQEEIAWGNKKYFYPPEPPAEDKHTKRRPKTELENIAAMVAAGESAHLNQEERAQINAAASAAIFGDVPALDDYDDESTDTELAPEIASASAKDEGTASSLDENASGGASALSENHAESMASLPDSAPTGDNDPESKAKSDATSTHHRAERDAAERERQERLQRGKARRAKSALGRMALKELRILLRSLHQSSTAIPSEEEYDAMSESEQVKVMIQAKILLNSLHKQLGYKTHQQAKLLAELEEQFNADLNSLQEAQDEADRYASKIAAAVTASQGKSITTKEQALAERPVAPEYNDTVAAAYEALSQSSHRPMNLEHEHLAKSADDFAIRTREYLANADLTDDEREIITAQQERQVKAKLRSFARDVNSSYLKQQAPQAKDKPGVTAATDLSQVSGSLFRHPTENRDLTDKEIAELRSQENRQFFKSTYGERKNMRAHELKASEVKTSEVSRPAERTILQGQDSPMPSTRWATRAADSGSTDFASLDHAGLDSWDHESFKRKGAEELNSPTDLGQPAPLAQDDLNAAKSSSGANQDKLGASEFDLGARFGRSHAWDDDVMDDIFADEDEIFTRHTTKYEPETDMSFDSLDDVLATRPELIELKYTLLYGKYFLLEPEQYLALFHEPGASLKARIKRERLSEDEVKHILAQERERSMLMSELRPFRELNVMRRVLLELNDQQDDEQRLIRLQRSKFNYYLRLLGRNFYLSANAQRAPGEFDPDFERLTNLAAQRVDDEVKFVLATILWSGYNLYLKAEASPLSDTYQSLNFEPPC